MVNALIWDILITLRGEKTIVIRKRDALRKWTPSDRASLPGAGGSLRSRSFASPLRGSRACLPLFAVVDPSLRIHGRTSGRRSFYSRSRTHGRKMNAALRSASREIRSYGPTTTWPNKVAAAAYAQNGTVARYVPRRASEAHQATLRPQQKEPPMTVVFLDQPVTVELTCMTCFGSLGLHQLLHEHTQRDITCLQCQIRWLISISVPADEVIYTNSEGTFSPIADQLEYA